MNGLIEYLLILVYIQTILIRLTFQYHRAQMDMDGMGINIQSFRFHTGLDFDDSKDYGSDGLHIN